MKAWIEVSRSAITHNIKQLKKLSGKNTKFMAVVKANAYGHGLIETARTAIQAGAEWLGVAHGFEGIALRKAGIKSPILTFFEPEEDEITELIRSNIAVTIYTEKSLYTASKIAKNLNSLLRCHIKINTGMNRLGVPVSKALDFIVRAASMPGIKIEGIYSHLATSEKAEDEFAKMQLRRFLEIRKKLERYQDIYFHIANTGGIINYPESSFDMVRAGIGIYGYFPSSETKRMVVLKPALSLKCKIVCVNEVMPGEGVSYGLTWRAKSLSRVAVCPVGYADGIFRTLSGKLKVAINGKLVSSVGIICMDQLLIDVTGLNIKVGDIAEIIGPKNNAEEIAVEVGTISYEVLSRLGNRIPRVYSD